MKPQWSILKFIFLQPADPTNTHPTSKKITYLLEGQNPWPDGSMVWSTIGPRRMVYAIGIWANLEARSTPWALSHILGPFLSSFCSGAGNIAGGHCHQRVLLPWGSQSLQQCLDWWLGSFTWTHGFPAEHCTVTRSSMSPVSGNVFPSAGCFMDQYVGITQLQL